MAKRHRRPGGANKRENVTAYLNGDAPREAFRSFITHFLYS